MVNHNMLDSANYTKIHVIKCDGEESRHSCREIRFHKASGVTLGSRSLNIITAQRGRKTVVHCGQTVQYETIRLNSTE